MKIIFFIFLTIFFDIKLNAHDKAPWNSCYQNKLMEKIGEKISALSTYPAMEYPNVDAEQIFKKYPDERILLFSYGSLINASSAARSVCMETVHSMKPVVAFGFKRIFNYKASNVSRWGTDLPENERAMLNIEPTTTYSHIINGVVMKISKEDLSQLIKRETGYDLVPMLIADWNEVISENPHVDIKIAYAFLVPDELRNGIDYTHAKYYPVRGYLHAARDGAAVFGNEFLDFWNNTTYLGDGTTTINNWNEKTFSGILDSKEP